MTAWQKFLNQIIPDPKLQIELQMRLGQALMKDHEAAVDASTEIQDSPGGAN